MAGRKSAEESKVREYILVPSFKLAALQQADAESVSNIPATHSNHEVQPNRKTGMPRGSDKKDIREHKPQGVVEKQPQDTSIEPEDDTDWETRTHTQPGGDSTDGVSTGIGATKKRRGSSLADRRKRLRLLWLDL